MGSWHRSERGAAPRAFRRLAQPRGRAVDRRGDVLANQPRLPPVETFRSGPLDVRSLAMLEGALEGTNQKVLALDFGVSHATVTAVLKRALQRLGIPAAPSRVPLLVSLLAQSATNPLAARALQCVSVTTPTRTYQLVSWEQTRSSWESVLSPAELAVVLLRAEGRTHAQIAALRRTSPRTVANQLGAAFRRLGLSGRPSLLADFAQASEPASARPIAL